MSTMYLSTNYAFLVSAIYLMFLVHGHSQMPTNKHEVEIDKVLQKENPKYYQALKSLLKEFENNLLRNKIVEDPTYKSYQKLLKILKESNDETSLIEFPLGESLKLIAEKYNLRYDSMEYFNLGKYYNLRQSKECYWNNKWVEKGSKEGGYRLPEILDTFLEVYEAADLELPLVKLKLFRYLDPIIDSVVYISLSYKH